ncbi:DEAD/DEAH box helicase [Cryobacterium sp. MDB1-18-2]|uniref:SNF2-related protein n=1 Tax=unclassified Cryobacterium TaxID=2649013 RepID=UPI00106A257B|nr:MULTISPECIES: DEAD/DEAH box helicase [unclassified Cryobacterium]TFC30095.1 DEAD/DEAH box helicase [Cryobacterium sp. MDB1-18-2]TFC41375.1 DEAD/DEAH box helicase [Cryobacterium sp. MDB1-18-1]
MTRTYGTYEYRPAQWTDRNSRGTWALTLEPAVRQRARRILGRTQATRASVVTISDSLETARDITWLMDRWPLLPVDARSERWLKQGAEEHRDQEAVVGQIIAGEYTRLDLPTAPAKEPRDYQLTAVDMLRARGRLLLTDEVGLGKTFTGLLNLVHQDALPALVVPPTHLPRRWVTELKEAFPWLTFEVAKKTTPSVRASTGILADVTIVPYSKISGWAAQLQNQVRTVIFDEVQELRNGEGTEKGKAAAMVADNATYVIGLTATPVYNYGIEIYNILDVMAPGELGTREEFSREWGGAAMSNGRMMVKDPAALGSHLRESGLMLGRTRKEVGRELPKTIKNPMLVDIDTAALDKVAGDTQALARLLLSTSATTQEKFHAAGQIDWKMRQATGVGKAPYVAEFVRLLLEAEEKIVMWGWHRDVYDIWMDKLAEFHPALYTGTESPKQKADAEDAFCTPIDPGREDNCRILIMSLRSGAGVDGLQKFARVGVFGELDWSPQVHEQAIGRLRRDGMGDDPPVAYFLNSAEGSDPAIMEVLQVKRQQSEPMLSLDGKLFDNAVQDASRAKRLAQQVLGLTTPIEAVE